MYDAIEDPYCYPNTTVLKNIQNLQDQESFIAFEAVATAQRANEFFPIGKLDVSHYQGIHHHLFQDVYSWAGEFRTVRLSKDGSAFCYPEHISAQMTALFENLKEKEFFQNLSREKFATELTSFLSALNAIHPFREGNGRTQNIFMKLLSELGNHSIDLEKLDPEPFLEAMILSFKGDDSALHAQILKLIS